MSDGALAPTCRQSCITIARYYDPATAQFLTVDPEVATTLSPYGYVQGNPLNSTDDSGLTNDASSGSPFGYYTSGTYAGCETNLDNGVVDCPIGNGQSAPFASGEPCASWGSFLLGSLEFLSILGTDGEDAPEIAGLEGASDATIAATGHGAERLAQAGFTDETIAATKAGQVFTQSDGATVYLNEASSGRYDFIVEGNNGVITAHTNWPLSSVMRIAQNYGWKLTP